MLKIIIISICLFIMAGCQSIGVNSAQNSLMNTYKTLTTPAYFLEVKGMVCEACVAGIKHELFKNDQITKVDVDLVHEHILIYTKQTGIEVKNHINNSLRTRGLDLISIQQK